MHACLYKKHFCSFNSLAQSCSHVGALLFAINRNGGDQKSKTSTLCSWKVPRPMTIKPVPLAQFNLSKSGSSQNQSNSVKQVVQK